MTLIKSISGIRGTIGGTIGDNLTALDVVECTAGFGQWLLNSAQNAKVVVGRDGRTTGEMVSTLVCQTLLSMGIDVVDAGLSTTPTVEMAVVMEDAGAGVVITASHNPAHWNALKFLNHLGEFISGSDGQHILDLIRDRRIHFAAVDKLGTYRREDHFISRHIDAILRLEVLDVSAIQKSHLHVVVDCINSTGALAIPPLLDALNVRYTLINAAVTGHFAHNPEPLPKYLEDLSAQVIASGADMGIAVDPDVDRLALICHDGTPFGEEYTLVAASDFVLAKNPGHTVSNLSSSRALSDVTKRHGGTHVASAVGEVHVVSAMKQHGAVIGGEGNGGVIYPPLHYGRDALVGIAFVLNLLAERGRSLRDLRASYPDYVIIKDKLPLREDIDLSSLFTALKQAFADERLNEVDGLKIDFADGWVHMRKSNTEPIIRIYAESADSQRAEALIQRLRRVVDPLLD